MTRIILASILILAIGEATVNAAPMTKAAATRTAEQAPKVKKRRGFKSIMAKSIGFVASSAVMGGMSDR